MSSCPNCPDCPFREDKTRTWYEPEEEPYRIDEEDEPIPVDWPVPERVETESFRKLQALRGSGHSPVP